MEEYKKKATEARRAVLELIHLGQTSHLSSNLSSIDILTFLFENLNLEQDELIISKGWVSASIHYFLSQKGILDWEEVKKRYCRTGEKDYIGLVEPRGRFAQRFAGGSMQMSVPAGVGVALAKKMKKEKGTVHILESDGAMPGGMIWESAAIANQLKLNNLVIWVDINGYQAMGKTEDIVDMRPLEKKWQSFGWDAKEIDGHNFSQIKQMFFNRGKKPLCVLAKTTKGKGVSFIEDNPHDWHYRRIDKKHLAEALRGLA